LAVGPGAGTFGSPPVQANLPVPAAQARRGGAPVPAGGPAPRKGSPFSISNWRVRWRLIAIITVPTVTALILGVIQIVSSVNNYSSFKRVQDLANLNSLVVNAAGLVVSFWSGNPRFMLAKDGVTKEDQMRDTLGPRESRELGCEISEDGHQTLTLVRAVY